MRDIMSRITYPVYTDRTVGNTEFNVLVCILNYQKDVNNVLGIERKQKNNSRYNITQQSYETT